MHYLKDIPNIVHEMKRRYPDIKVEVSEPLGTHPLMRRLIEQRICDALAGDKQQVGVIVVTAILMESLLRHTKSYKYALKICKLASRHMRERYMERLVTHDLESISKRYQKLIVVPLFLYDGKL